MRLAELSRSSPLRAWLVLLLLMAGAPTHSAAQNEAPPDAVQIAEIEAAVEVLRADPNLAPDRPMRVPRWRSDSGQTDSDWSALKWIAQLFGWISQLGRVFVWVVLALLLGVLLLYLVRLLRTSGPLHRTTPGALPTHVRDLDIRPESLPDDIGATAWELWERDEHRAALALLYRGLLSRLVHVHAVPIRNSSTEGDCLLLARQQLEAGPSEFTARLIRMWQRAVYGGQQAQSDDIRSVCEQFGNVFAPRASAEVGP